MEYNIICVSFEYCNIVVLTGASRVGRASKVERLTGARHIRILCTWYNNYAWIAMAPVSNTAPPTTATKSARPFTSQMRNYFTQCQDNHHFIEKHINANSVVTKWPALKVDNLLYFQPRDLHAKSVTYTHIQKTKKPKKHTKCFSWNY